MTWRPVRHRLRLRRMPGGLAVAGGSDRGSANPPEHFGGLADGNERKGVAIGLFWL
ncbi:MAG: hypothetical protein KAU60_05225 [Desulfobacterales bacterium]|nr:hypothetical protein [Desulfobacterales bacterium]